MYTQFDLERHKSAWQPMCGRDMFVAGRPRRCIAQMRRAVCQRQLIFMFTITLTYRG